MCLHAARDALEEAHCVALELTADPVTASLSGPYTSSRTHYLPAFFRVLSRAARSYDVRRINPFEASGKLTEFGQMMVREQEMLAPRLHIAKGPQKLASTIDCSTAAKVVCARSYLYAHIRRLKTRQKDLCLQFLGDRLAPFGI